MDLVAFYKESLRDAAGQCEFIASLTDERLYFLTHNQLGDDLISHGRQCEVCRQRLIRVIREAQGPVG